MKRTAEETRGVYRSVRARMAEAVLDEDADLKDHYEAISRSEAGVWCLWTLDIRTLEDAEEAGWENERLKRVAAHG